MRAVSKALQGEETKKRSQQSNGNKETHHADPHVENISARVIQAATQVFQGVV